VYKSIPFLPVWAVAHKYQCHCFGKSYEERVRNHLPENAAGLVYAQNLPGKKTIKQSYR
jgi:hypothetical protein